MALEQRDALLSVAQAAALLGVHPNTIRSWTDAGRLTAFRINSRGDRRFRRDDVERILVEDAPAVAGDLEIAGRSQREAELAIFERVAVGLATTPSPAAVSRALVEALRTEIHVDRAAVYLLVDEQFELLAHGGFDIAPAGVRPLGTEPAADGVDREILLAGR
jgi:excisionase family DNA binding protein